jgi:hypothetical protein
MYVMVTKYLHLPFNQNKQEKLDLLQDILKHLCQHNNIVEATNQDVNKLRRVQSTCYNLHI